MIRRTIFSMLDQASEQYTDVSYLNQKGDKGWEKVSFSEAKDKAQTLASACIGLGVQKDDKIAILSEAKNDWVISELAILYAGAVCVPLSIKLMPEEIAFRLNHSNSTLFFVSENTFEKSITQWQQYEYSRLKLIIMDKPSEKINKLCEKHQLDQKKILFIEDLYKYGAQNLSDNKAIIDNICQNTQEDDTVTISYTSGTTGDPKGIMLTHLNYYANSHAAVNSFRIQKLISTLIILPTDHSFAHTVGIFTSLLKGISLYFVDARGGGMNALKNIPVNLEEAAPNFLLTVPALSGSFINKMKQGVKEKGSFIEGIFKRGLKAGIKRNGNSHTKPGLWTQLISYPNYILAEKLLFKKLRTIFGENIEFFVGGGALLDIKQQQFYKAIGVPVYQGYGLTEASPIISSNTPFNCKMGTSGLVIEGVICKICDDKGKELPQGRIGEIVIKGDNVMKGYYKNPKASAEALRDGYLYTGDLGYIDEDNYLVVVGREKALLISEDGEKYSPEEIEEAITSSSSVISQAMIYNDHKKFTTALVTINKKYLEEIINQENLTYSEEVTERIREEVLLFTKQDAFKDKFPTKWIPSQIQIVEEEFSEKNKLINSTMKMVRHKISNRYKDRLDSMYLDSQKSIEKNNEVVAKLFNMYEFIERD